MGSVHYRLPDAGQLVGEAFLLRLQEALCSKTLVLPENLNHPDICWESSTASFRQSRRLLDNFWSQVIESPTRGGEILDLLVTSMSKPNGDIKIEGSLACGDHALVECADLRDMAKIRQRIKNF